MKNSYFVSSVGAALGALLLLGQAKADEVEREVGISHTLQTVTVEHNGEAFVIEREQDTANTVNPNFALTSRPCPPFCIQPMILAPGVDTIGELEVLGYLQAITAGATDVVVIDSRSAEDYAAGTIPGAVNLPWQRLSMSQSDGDAIAELLTDRFGVQQQDGLWDFRGAHTLVMFCNGSWCGQSPTNIKALLRIGYPADRIKWYRGGMQNWENLGLGTAWE